MSSENKKRKGKNANILDLGLKCKNKCKRLNFYNASVRQKNKIIQYDYE